MRLIGLLPADLLNFHDVILDKVFVGASGVYPLLERFLRYLRVNVGCLYESFRNNVHVIFSQGSDFTMDPVPQQIETPLLHYYRVDWC